MADPETIAVCEACGRPLPSNPGRGRPRRYCDATCRSAGRRERERTTRTADAPVKIVLTSSNRQGYLDVVGASGEPAGATPSRITTVAGRLAAELTQTGAGSPLAAMASARELATLASAALQMSADRARAAGYSWKEIGDVLETTRQAAFQRFGRPIDPRTGAPMTRNVLPGAVERAIAILADVAAGEWEAARGDFGPKMLEAVSASRIADVWAQMAALIGRYEGMGEPLTQVLGEYTQVDIPLHFEAGEATARVTFDSDGTVAGLLMRPAAQQ